MYDVKKVVGVTYLPNSGQFMCSETKKLLGKVNNTGYLLIRHKGFSGLAHRLAFELMGVDTTDMCVDHVNHDKLDNRFENLRLITVGENNKNKKFEPKRNTSGYTGVTTDNSRPEHQKFRAQVMINKKQIFLGRYPTAYEAHLAVVEARTRLGFHPNHGKAL